MNLVLLDPAEVGADGRAVLRGAAAAHVREVLGKRTGETLRVGVRGGARGSATLLAWSRDGGEAVVQVALDPADRPARPGLDLLLAIPRPRQLERCLHHAIALGAARVVLLRTWRVEHGFLTSKLLRPGALAPCIDEALAQVGSTYVPEVRIELRFKPFVEDALPSFLEPGQAGVVLDPAAAAPIAPLAAALAGRRVLLAIGPEGGFLPYEVEALLAQGLCSANLGPRILRVETAVPAAMAQVGMLAGGSEEAPAAHG